MANFGWLAVMWGILIAIWSIAAMPLMPDLTGLPVIVHGSECRHLIGLVLDLIIGVLLIARDSVLEVVELPTIICHVLSYARIVAVGLSSVAIAMVVNFMSIAMLIEPQLRTLRLSVFLLSLRGRRVSDWARAEHGTGYPRWRSPLNQVALC